MNASDSDSSRQPKPPAWEHCGYGADAVDPVGCRGIRVRNNTACLAHLSDHKRAAYLQLLSAQSPGADVNHRSTHFTESLLQDLIMAVRDPNTGEPAFGEAEFSEATFSDAAVFSGTRFTGIARFIGASFERKAEFDKAKFTRDASFSGATFAHRAWFNDATFTGRAIFGSIDLIDEYTDIRRDRQFPSGPSTRPAKFLGDAWFDRATFDENAVFGGVTFADRLSFNSATFTKLPLLGPLVCTRKVDLSGVTFETPMTMEIAADQVRCVGTRWMGSADLRLRYAGVRLNNAAVLAPVAISAEPFPFYTLTGSLRVAMDESILGDDAGVSIHSLQRVDAAHLTLVGTDLTECLFYGAFHLDQLRLEGRCTFARPPVGFHRFWIFPYCWWSRRDTLIEEHYWRAQELGANNPRPPRGWQSRSRTGFRDRLIHAAQPKDLSAVYRQLRKAFEDSKNEPGATDFYYGEMEMRRCDRDETPTWERGLLWMYWLLSGYGLRASRALVCLLGAMALTVLALMAWGLPTHVPLPKATGTLTGSAITLNTTKPDLTINGELMTLSRADRATRVVMNSVVFRSSGQNLTRVGTYIEMASRIFEPILLGLAVLAIRNRVKR